MLTDAQDRSWYNALNSCASESKKLQNLIKKILIRKSSASENMHPRLRKKTEKREIVVVHYNLTTRDGDFHVF